MNRLASMLLALLCICPFAAKVSANEYQSKMYVPYEAIVEIDDGVFFQLGDQLLESSELYEDDYGYYILDVIHITETCPKCDEYAMVDKKCMNCGYKKK
jgi:hypothetical protein